MDYVFMGGIYPDFFEAEISEKADRCLSYAADLHQKNIIKGLEMNLGFEVEILNSYFIPYYPRYTDIYVKGYKIRNIINTGFLNLRGIRQFSKYASLKSALESKLKTGKRCCVICYTMNYPQLRSIYELKRKFNNMHVCLIIPDIPQILAQYGIHRGIYRKISSCYNLNRINKYLDAIDSFVLLSEQMKDLVPLKGRKYCVVDGLFDVNDDRAKSVSRSIKDDGTVRLVYTGSLHQEYGICDFINAFITADVKNAKLIIAGNGNAVSAVKDYAKKYSNIEYKGILGKNEVAKLQRSASLLVNTRSSKGIDAKYSFPSKTIEYMLTGRPILMARLPGMSDEYFDYMYTMDDSCIAAMAESIKAVCGLAETELAETGRKAFEFVKLNNNNIVQAKKIIELIEG